MLDAFLEWVMWGFCYDASLDWETGKRFTDTERSVFPLLFDEWVKTQAVRVNHDKAWFDLFGLYYEAYVAGKSRRSSKGQFFTPSHICDLMVLTQGCEGQSGQRASDPTCGSGRLLLAFHARFPGNLVYAEDLDRTCCLMTVCNFIIHGAVGEVVHHNSLLADSWFDGWIVNEHLRNPFHSLCGIPHVRRLEQQESMVFCHWEQRKKEAEEQAVAVVEIQPLKQTQQLTLF